MWGSGWLTPVQRELPKRCSQKRPQALLHLSVFQSPCTKSVCELPSHHRPLNLQTGASHASLTTGQYPSFTVTLRPLSEGIPATDLQLNGSLISVASSLKQPVTAI